MTVKCSRWQHFLCIIQGWICDFASRVRKEVSGVMGKDKGCWFVVFALSIDSDVDGVPRLKSTDGQQSLQVPLSPLTYLSFPLFTSSVAEQFSNSGRICVGRALYVSSKRWWPNPTGYVCEYVSPCAHLPSLRHWQPVLRVKSSPTVILLFVGPFYRFNFIFWQNIRQRVMLSKKSCK